jgi:CRISPR type I-E-associated protein CasB/Cse2
MNEKSVVGKIFQICIQDRNARSALSRIDLSIEGGYLSALQYLGDCGDSELDDPLLAVANAIAIHSCSQEYAKNFGATFRKIASNQRFEAFLSSPQADALISLQWWIRLAKQHNRYLDYSDLLVGLRNWDEPDDHPESRKMQWATDFWCSG